MPELLNAINDYISNFNSTEFKDQSSKNKVNEQIKIINDKIKPKQKELPNLLNRIVSKEGKLVKRLSIEDSSMPLESFYSSHESRLDSEHNINNNRGSFRESKLVVGELIDNKEYLRKRQEELEDIKKVSLQVKDLTGHMKSEVEKQGNDLKSIEDNVVETNKNVHKAELEISEAEKSTRSSNKRIIWLIILLGLLVIFIIVTIILLTSKK